MLRGNMNKRIMVDQSSFLYANVSAYNDERPSNLQVYRHPKVESKISRSCNVNRGLLVVVEGLDRAGKDTLISHLVTMLEQVGESVMVQAFPDRSTESGIILDQFLRRETDLSDWECHNLYATNRRELEAMLYKTLQEGTTVICSRYAYSGVAYTAAKGYDIRKCMEADKGLLRPDLVVFLDVDADTVAVRNNFGRERYETREFQIKVYRAFQTLWGLLRASRNKSENKDGYTNLLIISPTEIFRAPERILRTIFELKEEPRHVLCNDLFHLELNSN